MRRNEAAQIAVQLDRLEDRINNILGGLDELEEVLEDVLDKLDGPRKLAYNITEAAEVLGVSKPHMYELIHREDFPTLKNGGRRLISTELLREWVRAQAGGTARKQEAASG